MQNPFNLSDEQIKLLLEIGERLGAPYDEEANKDFEAVAIQVIEGRFRVYRNVNGIATFDWLT